MSRSLPTSQRLRPPSPWLHPPWIQIVSSRLPMSLMEAPGARACVHYVWSSCLGHRNGAHKKIERWAEHRPWMAFAQWIYATTNRTMVSAMGGGGGEDIRTGGTRGGGRLVIVLGGEWRDKKIFKQRWCWGLGFRWLLLDRRTQQPTENRPHC